MYITCQQCNTIFRLDESLLKTTGSKVRCSQCRHVFVEYPPAPDADISLPASVAAIQAETEMPSEAAYDQELEGIDLDELDAIFEKSDTNVSDLMDESEAPLAALEADSAAELNDDDLDMDFDLASESEDDHVDLPDPRVDSEVDASEATLDDEANLDDMDLELDFELDAQGPQEEDAAADEELADRADDISEDIGLDLDDLDFSLDDDMAEEAGDDAVGEAVEAVDLDADLELDMDSDEDGDFAIDVDLSDDPISEELEDVLEAVDDEADDKEDDFDLGELDDMLGGNDTSGRVSVGVTRDVVDEDAELALDDASEDGMPEDGLAMGAMPAMDTDGADASSEGLDLSDLDAMLDEVDGIADTEADSPEDVLSPSDIDDGLEDLDFELDAEFEDKPVADDGIKDEVEDIEPAQAQDDEIDLSDIEQMLEGDADALDTQQLEADFLGLEGDSDGDEKWAEGVAPELDLDDTDEIDLDEIEAAIDQTDDNFVDDTIRLGDDMDIDQELSLDDESSVENDSPELELDLDEDIVLELEDDESKSGIETDQVEDDELDLSDLDLGEDPVSKDENEVIDANDIELEFQIEENEPSPDSADMPESAESVQDFSIEETVPAPQIDETSIEAELDEALPKAKKTSSKGLVAILIALLLAGGGYLYYAIAYQGMEIPYVSQYLKPQPKDPAGIFKLFTTDINSKFIDTENSGRLFVIEGKVRNGYSTDRQMVRLQGKLFTKGKVLAKSEFAYAGISISDEALSSQPVTDLKKKLNSGIAQGAGTKVNPGASLPFMIVFSELPDKLDEFAIEAISSMPSK